MARRGRGDHDKLTGSPFAREGDRIRLAVRVTPKTGRDAFAGIVATADGRSALAVRLAAPPVDGAANKALIAFLARSLGVPKGAVRIVSGQTGRLKILAIDGATPDRLSALIG